VELPAELSRRLALANARYSLGMTAVGDCVRLACNLIVAGVDGPAVVELAGESPNLTRLDGTPLVGAMFEELGLPRVAEETAAWIFAQDIAARMLSAELSLAAGGGEFWALCSGEDFSADLNLIVAGLCEWDCLIDTGADASTIRAFLTRLAEDVLREAAERLDR
jgi:hypothetical protein